MDLFFNEKVPLTQISTPLRALFALLRKELASVIENRAECGAIVQQLLCHYFQVDATDFILNSLLLMTPTIQYKLLNSISRLKKHEPLQYVMEAAYFSGNCFKVTPDVLIPRPETEEWLAFLIGRLSNPTTILDIGTGSGCIAIVLKQQFPQAVVDAVDISKEALMVARYNAAHLGVSVNFIEIDILTEPLPPSVWSLIVSNPPYVQRKEISIMHRNVVDYEPHLALFVDDIDPLLFYRRIIYLARHHLKRGGILCMEINEAFGKCIIDLLYCSGFKQIALHKDICDKDRWVMAVV